MVTRVVTSQAPDAKPVASHLQLTTTFAVIIDVPEYEVPELVFGGSTTVEPGVAEVISPLVVTNVTDVTATVTVEVYRFIENQRFTLINQLPIPGRETIAIPLNGQFLKTGDTLEVASNTNLALESVLSFTLGQSEEDDVV